MNKILVTGYPGFLARNFAEAVAGKNNLEYVFVHNRNTFPIVHSHNISYYKCDLLDKNQVKEMMTWNQVNPDCIVHLAAFTSGGSSSSNLDAYDNNVKMCNNLLVYARPWTRFIFASSSTVYGNSFGLEGNYTKPTSLYGASKVACESLLDVYEIGLKIKPLSLRFCAIVGPRHMTHGMVKDIFRKVECSGNELQLYGKDPGSIKPFLHVDKAIEAIIKFGIAGEEVGCVNICPGDNISARDAGEAVLEGRLILKDVTFDNHDWGTGDNQVVLMSNALAISKGLNLSETSAQAIERVAKEYKSEK